LAITTTQPFGKVIGMAEDFFRAGSANSKYAPVSKIPRDKAPGQNIWKRWDSRASVEMTLQFKMTTPNLPPYEYAKKELNRWMLREILSNGENSLLFGRLRKAGLVYRAYFHPYSDVGFDYCALSLESPAQKINKAVCESSKAFEELLAGKIDQSDFNAWKKQMVFRCRSVVDNPEERLMHFTEKLAATGHVHVREYERTEEIINKMTIDDVVDALSDILKFSERAVAVSAPKQCKNIKKTAKRLLDSLTNK
jgi:predicted Zn-dependent peptidase